VFTQLRNTLNKRPKEFAKVVENRPHPFNDATPPNLLGQEISGLVSQLDHGLRH